MKMTSAYANKMLKKLQEDKEYWLSKERENSSYIAAIDEEPVIPEYNYDEVSKNISDLDSQIRTIKHAVNMNNVTNGILVGDTVMTADEILVSMAQLNNRKSTLDSMRKQSPKTRLNSDRFSTKKSAPEYKYTNYDIDKVKSDYSVIDKQISEMQLALDKYNQTFEFDVEV